MDRPVCRLTDADFQRAVNAEYKIITRRGIKRNGSLLYTLIPMPEVVERYYEQQFTALDSTAERRRIQAKLSARQSA